MYIIINILYGTQLNKLKTLKTASFKVEQKKKSLTRIHIFHYFDIKCTYTYMSELYSTDHQLNKSTP